MTAGESTRELAFYIHRGGRVQFVHSDAAATLIAGLPGTPVVVRVSEVEVAAGGAGWQSRSLVEDGPVLGPFPLDRREDAIAAEVAWLEAHLEEDAIDVESVARRTSHAGHPAPPLPQLPG